MIFVLKILQTSCFATCWSTLEVNLFISEPFFYPYHCTSYVVSFFGTTFALLNLPFFSYFTLTWHPLALQQWLHFWNFFTQMKLTRLRISWLIEKNLSRKNKRLIQYYSIRQKLATDIALFSAISNTFGMMFLTTTVVFCPINAIMTLWILIGGLQKNFLPLLMIVNQILLIFVSHWYLTKCSLQIHLNCRPLLSLAVIGSKNKKFLKQRKNATESSEIRVQLKLANDICVLHSKK